MTALSPRPEDREIVFLGGLHRSGTTVLARALADHPAIGGLSGTGMPEDEGEHLQSVYPDCWEYGGVGRFGFAPEMHMTERSPIVSEQARLILWQEWARWWDLERPMLVEKSPPNMLKMRFLQALFPHARFVLVTRHPVAVVGATLKWRSRLVRGVEPHRLVRHWVHCHRLAFADTAHISHLHVMRYEDLVRDPCASLGALSAFLGLSEAPPTTRLRAGHSDAYFDAWSAGRDSLARGGYLRWIERRYGAAIAEHGYVFGSPRPLPGAGAAQAPAAAPGC